MNTITPNEVFEDAAPLADAPAETVNVFTASPLLDLEGKNVHVAFRDGTSETGLLNRVQLTTFIVGDNLRHRLGEVKSYREV